MKIQCLAVVSGLFFFASSAEAQRPDMPAMYHGTWQVVEKLGDVPSCSAADADIRMSVSAKEISLPGGYCLLDGIMPGGEDPLQFQAYCEQEDSENVVIEEWRVTNAGQRQFLTVKSLHPGYPYEHHYGRC